MKSKKLKGKPTTPRTSEEDLALPSSQHQHRSNAFSFLKNRFFHGSNQQQQHSRLESAASSSSTVSTANVTSSPRPSTSSTRSATIATKSWSIDNSNDNNELGVTIATDKPISRSFEENYPISDLNPSPTPRKGLGSRSARPMSMMGLESLTQQQPQQSDLTISLTKPTAQDALIISTATPRRRNSTIPTATTPTAAEKRTSLIIIKEGYLFKKTDFKPFHKQTKLDRGWKLYRVVLRGHKLYLYKLTTESPLRSLFPSPHHHQPLNYSLSSNSISSSTAAATAPQPISLKLVKADFDSEAQRVFLLSSTNPLFAQGAIFMELNQVTMQPKNQAQLVFTADGFLYICNKPNNSALWKIDTKYSTAILKVDSIQQQPSSTDIEATSPSSTYSSSSQQNYFTRATNSHSNGLLLFSISYINRPSILGVYSTQYRDIGQTWINTFQNHPHHHSFKLLEDISSSGRSGGDQSSLWRLDEDWDDSTLVNAAINNSSRMYDATQRIHPDLLMRNNNDDRLLSDNQIQGGTLNALVHELLFNSDSNLLHVFLTTYSTFTTGARVLTEFRLILSDNNLLESRLLDIFIIWCQEFSLDVMGDVASSMMSILELNEIIDKPRANQVKELVLKTLIENGKRNCELNHHPNKEDLIISAEKSNSSLFLEEEEEIHFVHHFYSDEGREVENITAYETEGKRRGSINLSNLLITGLTPAVFLMIDPTSFAQQIYHFHHSKQKQYHQDLLNPLSYLPRPQLSVQMLNSLLFTTAYPHFLTKLIRNQVLIETQQQHEEIEECMLTRSRLLEHWIRIGIHLLELGDMTGWCAVAMGVCSVGIVRLRETWKAVDRDLVNHVQTDWVLILTDYGLFSQNIWAEGWEGQPTANFAKVLDIRDLSLSDVKDHKQSLPFFGTIRQSVDRVRKHVKKLLGPNIVNFDECQCIYDTITSSLDHWKKKNQSVTEAEEQQQKSTLPVVGPLQSFFEHSITDPMSVPHDYKYLQECSLACEPRIFGQGFDRHKFNGHASSTTTASQPSSNADVAPPSTSPLIFPKILDNCSLLDIDHVATTPTLTTAATGLTSAASSSAISVASSQHKKADPRSKTGSSTSIRSIRSFLEDGCIKQSSNLGPYSSTSSLSQHKNTNSSSSPETASPKGANRKAFRRRTYSFPPGSGGAGANASCSLSAANLLESENSRTWLGSLISNRHHRTYSTKALIEAHRKSRAAQYGHNGEIVLSVQQGELVFKAAALLKKDDSTTVSSPEEEEKVLKKTESVCSMDFLKKAEEELGGNEDTLLVTIKAGYLDHLVDSLVRGVLPHEEALKDQWQMMSLAEGLQYQVQPGKIAMDEEEYINVFFTTFRIYCSSVQLLDMLRKKFMEAKSICKATIKKKKNSLILLETYFTPDGGASASPTTKQQQPGQQQQDSNINLYDWKKVADIQLRVLNLFIYWVEEHPYDFVDEIEISRYIGIFLNNAKQALDEWRVPLSNHHLEDEDEEKKTQYLEALTVAHTIEQRIIDLRTTFIRKNLSPTYDMKAISFDPGSSRGAEELYRQLTSGTTRYHTTLQLATNKLIPLSISSSPRDTDAKSLVDRFAPKALLEQLDRAVRQLFSAATMQDWIQTFDVFEAQSGDLYAWLPARKPSRTSRMSAALAPIMDAPSSHIPNYHVLSDEVIISDIFTAIEGAKRSVVSPSAFSDDDLFLAFPGSIQYLYCMHFIIRSWVINEIAAMEIDSKTRVLRIEKYLQIVTLSKISSEKMVLFPELKEVSAGSGKSTSRVPGFVEYAIASALVSPEVRIFTKAWNDVAMQHGHANLDTLENLLNQIQKTQPIVSRILSPTLSSSGSSGSSSPTAPAKTQQLVVPSLGWIFERIMELCFHIPDTFDKRDNMINFDKRRCVYQFLQLIMNVQVDLDEQQVEAEGISMSFLLSPNFSNDNWKGLKELAVRENKKTAMGSSASGSLVLRGPSSKSYVSRNTVFNKLVAEQMEKLKRDFKERDRIDKEWLSLQHKLQKKQLEQARLVEKQDRKAGMSKSQTQLQLSQPQQQHQQHGHSVMPRINSFLRGLRPQSMMASPTQHHLDSSQHFSTIKASTVINLIHSTTSVASTYTKREFVFRIVTEEGGQYLFQAMNREDMFDWMQHVNNSAREGAAKRQSVLAAESLDNEGNSNQQRRHSAVILGGGGSPHRNQPASRTSVYGVTLDSLMRDGEVPLVVDKCIREIERRGLEEVGIYRVAGTGSVVSALKAEFNKDVNKVDLSRPAWADINVVADALKQFLRELPEPLLTYTYYDGFINASASEDHDERVYLIKKVIKKLPYSNYILLKRIIEHFVIVTDFEATNHMYATNLAIVFGPTLLQPTPGPASFATTMSNLGHHQNIVKYLILNYHYLFDVEGDEVEPLSKDEDRQTHDQQQIEQDKEHQVTK